MSLVRTAVTGELFDFIFLEFSDSAIKIQVLADSNTRQAVDKCRA